MLKEDVEKILTNIETFFSQPFLTMFVSSGVQASMKLAEIQWMLKKALELENDRELYDKGR